MPKVGRVKEPPFRRFSLQLISLKSTDICNIADFQLLSVEYDTQASILDHTYATVKTKWIHGNTWKDGIIPGL